MRITTDEQLNELVARVVAVLPQQTTACVTEYLDRKFTAYNRETREDAHISSNRDNAKYYLPFPNQSKFVARLHASVNNEIDEYDI